MHQPEHFRDLAKFLALFDIDAAQLAHALEDYLENIGETIRWEYDHYADPYGFLQAVHYQKRVKEFSALLNEAIDDGTRIEIPTQQGPGRLGTRPDEGPVRPG